METVSTPSRQMSWQKRRLSAKVLAEMALRQERVQAVLAELREAHDLTQEQQELGEVVLCSGSCRRAFLRGEDAVRVARFPEEEA